MRSSGRRGSAANGRCRRHSSASPPRATARNGSVTATSTRSCFVGWKPSRSNRREIETTSAQSTSGRSTSGRTENPQRACRHTARVSPLDLRNATLEPHLSLPRVASEPQSAVLAVGPWGSSKPKWMRILRGMYAGLARTLEAGALPRQEGAGLALLPDSSRRSDDMMI